MNAQPTVLLVEDDNDTRSGFKSLFINENCKVKDFDNYDEAIKHMNNSKIPINLIFTDINLEKNKLDKSGIAFAKFAKKVDEYKDIPIVACSGIFSDNEISKEERSYFKEWFHKNDISKDLDRVMLISSKLAKEHFELKSGIVKKTITPQYEDIINIQFDILVKENENKCEIQVVDAPTIVSWGDSYDEALDFLFDIMKENSDIITMKNENLSSNLQIEKEFLSKTLNKDKV